MTAAFPLRQDIKERAEKLCKEYGYLEVFDPGTCHIVDGMTFVLVHDQQNRSLWLQLPDEPKK